MRPIGGRRFGDYSRKHRDESRAVEKTRAAREFDPTEFDGIAEQIEADIALASPTPATPPDFVTQDSKTIH